LPKKKVKEIVLEKDLDSEPVEIADSEPVEIAEEEESVEPIPKKVDPRTKWYVIHTYSGYENKVMVNLERRIETLKMGEKIFKVLVPTEEEIEFKNGKKKTVQRKIYPGYVLVQMIMTDDSWYVVRNTSGVTGFVGPGIKPIPLPEDEVKMILRRMGVDAPLKIRLDMSVGQMVRVIHGPFKEFQGVIEEVDPDREKMRVLISFLGRETPVELDFGQVEKMS